MTRFYTSSSESFKTKLFKLAVNLFPSYRRSGGRITFIAADWQEIHVKLSLNWSTRNYVGSIFGGCIYAALDPIYMLQLIKILGDNYVVWDKAATINFIKPIKGTVFAKFEINEEIISDIRTQVLNHNKYIIQFSTEFIDKHGIIYTQVDKTLYIADKTYYNNKPN